MLQKLFDQGHIELRLPRSQQQREADGLASDDRKVNLMDILEINKDVVYRGGRSGVAVGIKFYAARLRIWWRVKSRRWVGWFGRR